MSNKYIHSSSCVDQLGYGLATYKGIPYQEGYGLYQGQVFQRGFGLGGSLGNFYKATLRPKLSKAKAKILPAVKRIGRNAVNRAGKRALSMGMDVALRKKKPNLSAAKEMVKDLLMSSREDAIKEVKSLLPGIVQSGSGANRQSAARKRKRKRQGQSTYRKKQRTTIFD